MIDATEIADVIEDMCDRVDPGELITANDVWSVIGHDATLAHPNGTMGRGFTLARKAGLIEATGEVTKSDHPKRKHGMIMKWRVL